MRLSPTTCATPASFRTVTDSSFASIKLSSRQTTYYIEQEHLIFARRKSEGPDLRSQNLSGLWSIGSSNWLGGSHIGGCSRPSAKMTEIVMSQTPPILHGPTEKEKKYDRQLRLWAANGQAALESANILLVNSGAGAVGVETLKNLVLPGIGKFTIADDAIVNQADLGVNFFLDESCLGKLRSECCTKLLQELNPEVQGEWFPKEQGTLDLSSALETSPTYTLIMYTHPIKKEILSVIESYASQNRTPLVRIHSAGFYSYFHVNLPGTFPIVDTHPEVEKTTDLRLLNPWPELVEFSRDMTKDIDALNDHEHGHLPYVVILLHYLEEWRRSHNGQNPISYNDKTAFSKFVSSKARTANQEGGEENFQEAAVAINKNIKAPELEPGVQELFSHQLSDEIELQSTFWVIAKAVETFYRKHNCLPLPGALPDMKAQSSVYVKLQSIYKEKARKDAHEVLETARIISGGKDVDPAEVELFCKNARFVKLINATSTKADLDEIYESEVANDEAAEAMKVETEGAFTLPMSNLFIYLALVATSHSITYSADEIMTFVTKTVPKAAGNERALQAAQEVARAGGGELHNISALTGGMVAQEIIKIITKQYIPIENTCIFDGISSRCQVLRL